MKKIHSVQVILFSGLISIHCCAQTLRLDSVSKDYSNSPTFRIDSLNRILFTIDQKTYNGGAKTLDLLFAMVYECIDYNNDLGLLYLEKALPLAYRSGDSAKIVLAKRYKTTLLLRLERNNQALKEGNEALVIAQRHNYKREVMFLLNHLGLLNMRMARYDEALKCFFETLKIREEFDNKPAISITLNNIALTYFLLKDNLKAIEFYKRAIELKTKIGDGYDLDRLLINTGLAYQSLEKYDSALIYINSGISSCKQHCSDNIMMEAEYGLGFTYFGLSQLSVAERHLRRSYSLSQKINNKKFKIDNLIYLSKVKVRQTEYKLAETYLKEAELIMDSTIYKNLWLEVFRDLSAIFVLTKRNNEANIYFKKYIELQEEIYDEKLISNLAEIRSNFSERENLAKLKSQGQIMKFQSESISRQILLNILFGLIALMTISLTIVFFRLNKQKKQINSLLGSRLKERTVELETSRIEMQHSEDEFEVILEKLSNELISSLATLRGLTNLAEKQLPQGYSLYFKKAESNAEGLIEFIKKYALRRSKRGIRY